MSTRARTASNSTQVANAPPENENVESDQESEESDTDGGTVRGWSPATGKSRKTRYICKGGQKVCGLSVSRKGDSSIRCDSCKDWFHPRCQGLSMDAFRALSKYDFLWLCIDCRPKFEAILELGKNLETRIAEAERKILDSVSAAASKDGHERLTRKIDQMEKAITQMKDQQSKIEVAVNEQKDAVKSVPKCTEALKTSALEIKKIVQIQNRDSRESNVILHNIPESTSSDPEARKKHDAESFQGVVSSLLGNEKVDIVQVFRLGKRETQEPSTPHQKSRLMMIKLKDREHVEQLIKKRTQLKEVGYPNVYLTRDLSPEERTEQKKLREELMQKGKDTHRIFRGKVVPRTQ